MGAKIAYECAAPAHYADASQPDKLTIYKSQWAFCQFSARADDHEWQETGGADVALLLRKAGLHVAASNAEVAKVAH